MRALCDIVGLPVVNWDSGELVGEIKKIHWNEPEGEITGITVSGNHGLLYLPYDAIDHVGQDAAFIRGIPVTDRRPELGSRSLSGLVVYDQDGNELGSVDDLMVDFSRGKVSGLSVSGGLWRDIFQGRQFVPWESAQLGKDAIIVATVPDSRGDGK